MCRWILVSPYQPGSSAFPIFYSYSSFSSAFLFLRTATRGSGWNFPLWNRTTLQDPHASSVVVHAPTLPVCTDITVVVSRPAPLLPYFSSISGAINILQNLLIGLLLLLLYDWSNSQGCQQHRGFELSDRGKGNIWIGPSSTSQCFPLLMLQPLMS